jgi:HSP20 family molecular chaperone IbpA
MNNSSSVFVVTDGLTFTNGTTGTATFTTGISTPTIHTSGTTYLSSGTNFTPSLATLEYRQPTYNDFWKFDEEFDLLWKSFFDPNALYRPIKEKAVTHPCDIQETDNGLCIEIAAVGLDKEELNIIVDSETLRVAYRKPTSEEEEEQNEYRYFQRSIKKASFDIAWKISSKFDLSKLEAKLDKGLLTLDIPFAKENKPKKVTIK